MYIKSIELNNFRIYKGKNKIDILPENNKNIILISGKNGYGKTTLLMSLVWCLYGKQMDKVDELYKKEINDKGGYSKYIGKSLNRLAEQEGQTTFSVSVTFTNVRIPEITCNEIKIVRSYDLITKKEYLEILIDGHPNELIQDLSSNNQDGGEIFIREFILPLEIAKFFFFDAEKIVSLAEVDSAEQRRALAIAYSEVLGIHKYEELKNQLISLQDDYKKKAAKPEDRKKFNEIETSITNAEIDIVQLSNEIENLSTKKLELQHEADEIQKKLIKEGHYMTVDQINELKEQERTQKNKLNKLQEELKELFDLIPFGLVGETLMDISQQLELERIYKQNQFKKDDYNHKVNVFLQELEYEINAQIKDTDVVLDRRIKDFYKRAIEKLIKSHFYSEEQSLPDDFQLLHSFSDTQITDFNGIITNLVQSFRDQYTKINIDYIQTKRELDSIRRKLREAEINSEDSYIAGLRTQREKILKEIEKLESEILSKTEQKGIIKNKLKILRQQREELRKKIDVADKNKAKNELIEKEIAQIKEFISKFKEEKKKSLEQKMKDKLNTLLHKKNFITRVDVDINTIADNVEITLYSKTNGVEKKIDKGSLSMGERQMYASALLSALVEESNIEFPVFIDSPIQKFDDDHATNVIKYFYPDVSDQVVLFPLIHTELSEAKYELLKNRVSKAYLIHNENNESSSFIEVEPNELINKYNELYVASN